MQISSIISDISRKNRQYFAKIFQKSLKLVQKGWTQGDNARDADGRGVVFTSSKACSYCTVGATYAGLLGEQKTFETPEQTKDKKTMIDIIKYQPELLGWYITDWNDAPEREQKDVVKLFTDIIAQLKA